uniref:Uncharacterized protein n=1 Tax=Arundo donax TaxID=35708 RepID=A0A0A8ZDG1_ARUDO
MKRAGSSALIENPATVMTEVKHSNQA